MNRREFIGGAAAAFAAGAVGPAFGAGAARRDGYFIVIGDPHVPDRHGDMDAEMDAINALSPRPECVIFLGDNTSCCNEYFGDRSQNELTFAKEEKAIAEFKRIAGRLKVPYYHVVGNHDTYPDEVDAKFYSARFPGYRPYWTMDVLGVRMFVWNGGQDAHIDPVQREWILREARTFRDDETVAVVVHQPVLGLTSCERGIGQMVREAFAGRRGETWLLGGHLHRNAFEVFDLPRTRISQAAHGLARNGWWRYDVKDGRIVARTFQPCENGHPKGDPVRGEMPGDVKSKGLVPLPFEGRTDVLYKVLVGEGDDTGKALRVAAEASADAGHWYYYVGEVLYRLPLAKARGATRIGVLGSFPGQRRSWARERILVAGKDRKWREIAWQKIGYDLYGGEIPEAMRGGDVLYVQVLGYSMSCDTAVAGFALLK